MHLTKSLFALISLFCSLDTASGAPNPIPQASPGPAAVPQTPSGPPITVSDNGSEAKALTDCITSSNLLSLSIGVTTTAPFILTAGSWWVSWHEQLDDPIEQ